MESAQKEGKSPRLPGGLSAGIPQGIKKLWVYQIWRVLISGEGGNRRLALLFFLSSVGAIWVSQLGISRFLNYRKLEAQRAARMSKDKAPCVEMSCAFNEMEELAKKKSEIAEIKAAMVNLGDFELALVMPSEPLGERRAATPGHSGMTLGVEISVEFDSGDTGRWVQANATPARSEVLAAAAALSGMTRADLLSVEGKARVRDRIRDRLDAWLPSGKVKGVYFSKFLLE
jgi:hypothetical protein